MLDPEFVGQEFRDLFDQKLTWGETLGVDRHSTWDVLRRLAPTTNRGEEPTSETGIFEGVARCVERMLAVK